MGKGRRGKKKGWSKRWRAERATSRQEVPGKGKSREMVGVKHFVRLSREFLDLLRPPLKGKEGAAKG